MSESWRTIERLFHQVVDMDPAARSRFLDKACGDDRALRKQVDALVASDATTGFMGSSAMEAEAKAVAEDGPRLAPGQTLGAYAVVDFIGQGGMGEVYRAHDQRLERDIALKVLPLALALDQERLERFEQEARLLATVNHPNVATIHGIEEVDGQRVLVLELVEGQTLADRLKSRLDLREALQFALQIAEGLEAAHAKGIIHRDLKPENVAITHDDRVKLLDFGLAKTLGISRDERRGTAITVPPATTARSSGIAGTVAYMSPEQARGESVDRRSDIWAFGALLYEMLAGQRVSSAITSGQSPNTEVRNAELVEHLPSGTPWLVSRLVRRALTVSLRDRLQHIGDARIDLQDALAGLDGARVEPNARTTRQRVWGLGGLALAALVAVAAWFPRVGAGEPFPASATRVAIGPLPAAGAGSGSTPSVAISPEGLHVAYEDNGHIYVKAMDARGFTALAEGTYPFFSSDGRWLAYFTGDGLYRMPVGGGSSSPVVRMGFGTGDAGRVLGGAWEPDDTIVFATRLGLFRISAEGGERPTLLIAPPDGEAYGWPHAPPGGGSVLFSKITGGSAAQSEISSLDLESLAVRTIQQGGVGAQLVAGHTLVYATGARLEAVEFDTRTHRTRGVPVEIPAIDVVPRGAYLVPGFAVSDTGTLVQVAPVPGAPDETLVLVDQAGRTEPISGLPSDAFSYARFSPDGTKLALNVHQADLTNRRIWTLDLERGVSIQVSGRRLAASSFEDLLPQWHPNGERIFFSSNRSGAFQIYSVAADGSGAEVRLIENPAVQMPYRIDRSNRMLFFRGPFQAADTGILDLSELEAGPQWVLAQPWSEVNAVLSDDGRWIAYESNESGNQYEVYVRPYPDVLGERVQVSSGGGRQPLWSPLEPDVLYYRHPSGAMMAAHIKTAPGLGVRWVTQLFSGRGFRPVDGGGWSYDISPTDGRFVLLTAREPTPNEARWLHVTLDWRVELERLLSAD